jgi:ubiquinone/menaquinone biosynthesis C-methylase UbiE
VQPIDDVRAISRIAYGFAASKALFAALEHEIFGELDAGPLTISDLAQRTGIAPVPLRTLVATLVALGLVVRQDETFANAPGSARYLVPGKPAYFGDYYRLQINRQLYPAMVRLEAGLAGDAAALLFGGEEGLMADPAQAAVFSLAQHAGSLGPAVMLARGFDLAGRRRMLDVAGGTGAFSISLCQRNSALSSTILDFPNVVALARDYVADADLSDRIAFIGGNALEVDWPTGQDVVLMSYLLSAVPDAAIDVLFSRAAAALAPGGLLLVHDFMLDDSGDGPDLAAQWFLINLALSPHGTSFSAAELAPRLERTGLRLRESRDHIHDITRLLVAERAA